MDDANYPRSNNFDFVRVFVSFHCSDAYRCQSFQLHWILDMLRCILYHFLRYFLVLVVHTFKAKAFGEERIEKIFLCVNILFSLLSTVIAIANRNYDSRTELKSCFGMLDEELQFSNSTLPKGRKLMYCDVSSFTHNDSIIFQFVQFFCVVRAFTNLIVGLNLPEGFFYYKIFKSMKR